MVPDQMDEARLPDYERPPVVETILGVQFDRLEGFRNAHLGAFWRMLGTDEWPGVFDAPPLQPQFERFAESARWAKAGAQLTFTQDLSSRLQINNKDGDRMIQIQNGRLHFNWLGQAGGPYPRYGNVRDGFVWALQRFLEFTAEEDVGEFRPNQWEITYLSHIPKGTVWNVPNDWGFFRPLGAVPTIEGLVEAEGFGGEWHFVIPGQRGRLHMQWQHALRAPQGEGEQGQEMIRLTLTARGPVDKSDDLLRAILEGLDLGRKTIVCSFKSFMSNTANQYWGLRHAGD